MTKFSCGEVVYWFKGETLNSGHIHIVYTTYLVTKEKDVVDIDDCYFSKKEAIDGMRKELEALEFE